MSNRNRPSRSDGDDAIVTRELGRLDALVPGPPLPIDGLRITGRAGFASAFDVDTLALTSVAAGNLASGTPMVNRDRVATAFTGHVEVNGTTVPAWADLSGYYRTADDGFIQFHCNFDHHGAGIVAHLGCAGTREAVQQAVLDHDPVELEADLIEQGLVAARIRTLDDWSEHPHAAATVDLPLITVEQIGEAPPRPGTRRPRVLDCTRIIAGPVAGQTLAAHGADVLRVGSPHLPSIEMAVIGTGFAKRNGFVDLATDEGCDTFRHLQTGADIWLDAYRPGSFAARGFPPESAAPGTVMVQISAFDWIGPWAGRRGFDSIVQSTTGLVTAGSAMAGVTHPVPLPVQALDYATGHLAAYTATKLLAHQADVGGTWLARLSLLRTRDWLVSLGGPWPFEPGPTTPIPEELTTTATAFGSVTAAKPVGGSYAHGPERLGSSAPVWLDDTGR